ncbi:MAG: hypothetical protein ACRD0Y_05730 [Terriglobales bacterium]
MGIRQIPIACQWGQANEASIAEHAITRKEVEPVLAGEQKPAPKPIPMNLSEFKSEAEDARLCASNQQAVEDLSQRAHKAGAITRGISMTCPLFPYN